jgi:hypothetical protein
MDDFDEKDIAEGNIPTNTPSTAPNTVLSGRVGRVVVVVVVEDFHKAGNKIPPDKQKANYRAREW